MQRRGSCTSQPNIQNWPTKLGIVRVNAAICGSVNSLYCLSVFAHRDSSALLIRADSFGEWLGSIFVELNACLVSQCVLWGFFISDLSTGSCVSSFVLHLSCALSCNFCCSSLHPMVAVRMKKCRIDQFLISARRLPRVWTSRELTAGLHSALRFSEFVFGFEWVIL